MRGSRLLASGLALFITGALAFACGSDDGPGAVPSASADGGDTDPAAVMPNDPTEAGGAEAEVEAGPPPVPSEFGLDARPANATCLAPPRPPSDVAVKFTPVFASLTLTAPMLMRQAPGDATRTYIALRAGTLVRFTTATPAIPATVLTVPNVNDDGEGGLLGFAFHPKFAQNGQVYLSYTATAAGVSGSQMRSVIARMTSTDGGATFAGYSELLTFDQTTATNHKGGSIEFGPDGFLYFGFGDGGGSDDTFTHGQLKDLYFGKIHRIDVDTAPASGQAFVIPAGNPFKNGGGQASTYAYGIRNPFRFSFDRGSGDLLLGDVGQNQWEEIDRIQAPGANLAWPCREGANDHITSAPKCPNAKAGFLEPIFQYPHSGAQKAIIGGAVYRGKALPQMVGTYIFGDEVSGEIWALKYDPVTGLPSRVQLNSQGPNGNWTHFAEDTNGELYAVDLAGKIYQMTAATGADAGAPVAAFPDMLSKTGCVDKANPKLPASGLIPYSVNSPLWSDGAQKERWLAIPDGAKIAVDADGHLDLPIGSVLVKTFSLGGKRIETRLLARHTDGGWAGYTYEWDDAETDATLLPSSKSKTVGAQSWYYPSRSDCFSCHSGVAKRTLGMELGQLNRTDVYPTTNRISNQLVTLDHIGMFAAPLSPIAQIVAYPTPEGTEALEARARSYMHTNCSMCHRPNGNGGGPMDLRFATSLGNAKACNVAPDNGDLGVAGAKLLVPGDLSRSLLSLRLHALDAKRMPPLATHIVDTAGVGVLDSWIQSLASCPP